VEFLSRFTGWRPFEHRVRAQVDGVLYPMPINRTTINRLYGLNLDEAGVAAFYARVALPRAQKLTSEDVVLATVGQDLCDKFYRGYTRKQWGLDLSELSASVVARIPVRTNDDDRYFGDSFQCMPQDGYTAMFERMLDHPLITFETGVDFAQARERMPARHVVYTGPIDGYFGHAFGALPYRSLEFQHEHVPGVDLLQPVATINYPNDTQYTRCTEFKHITGQQVRGTSLVRETPCAEGEPYYPIPRAQNEALFQRYWAQAAQLPDVTFVGRLAQYRYYNMDQVVGAALAAASKVGHRLRSVPKAASAA
jgi:UDP-galactopyranose mutase